jgi:hypothetical protein
LPNEEHAMALADFTPRFVNDSIQSLDSLGV